MPILKFFFSVLSSYAELTLYLDYLLHFFQFFWMNNQWLTRPSYHPSLTDQSIVNMVLQGELAPAYLFLGGHLSFRSHSLGTTALLHALLIPPCYPLGQGKEFAAVGFVADN